MQRRINNALRSTKQILWNKNYFNLKNKCLICPYYMIYNSICSFSILIIQEYKKNNGIAAFFLSRDIFIKCNDPLWKKSAYLQWNRIILRMKNKVINPNPEGTLLSITRKRATTDVRISFCCISLVAQENKNNFHHLYPCWWYAQQ